MRKEGSVQAGHELSGIHARGVGIFIVGFIVCLGAILIAIWLIIGVGARKLELADRKHLSQIGMDTPEPLDQPLQPSVKHPTLDWQDMAKLRNEQTRTLHQYGRIQGDATHVRVPIERAMQMLMEHRSLLISPDGEVQALTQPAINTTQPATVRNRT